MIQYVPIILVPVILAALICAIIWLSIHQDRRRLEERQRAAREAMLRRSRICDEGF